MINFYTFKTLNEAADETTHIKHLHHSEENVFHGKHSLNHAIDSLSGVHNKLQGKKNNTEISTKLDGSVSLVFGHHPITKKFFVATKSAFNKEPKLNYTHEDIEHNHGHAPGLCEKLHHSLNHLPKVSGKEGVYQSDLMYSGDDKKTDTKGDHHFTPNTITYHVNKNSPQHKEVSDSKIGVAVHTKYEGTPHHAGTLEGMKATQFDGRKNLQHHKDVHLTDTNFKMNGDYKNKDKVEHHLAVAKNISNSISDHDHEKIQHHATMMKTYINQTVKDDSKPNIADYRKYSDNKLQKEVDKLKSDKGKAKKTDIKNEYLKHIDDNHEHLNKALQIHDHLQKAKDLMINDMNKSKHSYEHTINSKHTDPEGFAISHKGVTTKMVNRKEFSKNNFSNDRFKSKKEDE
jgi:hypothetical protein